MKNHNWSLDIITPTLNAERYLENCLISVKKLKCKSIKHFLVDSGSIDDSKLLADMHDVPVFYCPPGNMYAAINKGISESDGDWVTYINADDIFFPESIESAINSCSDDCDVIYGNIDYIDSDGRFLHHWSSAEPQHLKKLFSAGVMPLPQQGTIFRRSLWKKLNGFQERYKYSSDFDFFMRANILGAKFYYHNDKSIAAFRVHGNQISQNYSSMMNEEVAMSIAESGIIENRYYNFISFWGFRLRNLSSYMVRVLRHKHIFRKFRIPRTID